MTTMVIKVRVSPNLIVNNLSAKPGELANLHKGTLTNHVGNEHHVVVQKREGDNVSRTKSGTWKSVEVILLSSAFL